MGEGLFFSNDFLVWNRVSTVWSPWMPGSTSIAAPSPAPLFSANPRR